MKKTYITKNLNLTLFLICLSIILVIGYISKSYAIYKLEKKYDLKKNKIINYKPGDVEVAVLVDGKESSSFPTYEDNYLVTNIECSNGATGSWDAENWRIAIDDMSVTSTKCTVSFDSTRKNEIAPINLPKNELVELVEQYKSITIDRLKTAVLDTVYPVGSVYMSTEDDTVAKVQARFGGTWVKYSEGTMLLGANASYPVNTTGGSTTSCNSCGTSAFSIENPYTSVYMYKKTA